VATSVVDVDIATPTFDTLLYASCGPSRAAITSPTRETGPPDATKRLQSPANPRIAPSLQRICTQITCRLNSRTYSPIMRTAELPPIEIPWWNGRQLHFRFA